MYCGASTQRSCARAWVAAAHSVMQAGDEAYNVVIDVSRPYDHDGFDNQVIGLVDKFLKAHGATPIATVANTIFPAALYAKHGSPELYSVYNRDFHRLSKSKRWGRYFQRMTHRVSGDGTVYNPLDELIGKLRKQNVARRPYKATYELAIYNPDLDRRRYRDAPCLSHLSFKRHPECTLSMTAMYRNHAYIARCLGNLIGLGRLLWFVATQADLRIGNMTCISTHAELDHEKWGITDARDLVKQADVLLKASGDGVSARV